HQELPARDGLHAARKRKQLEHHAVAHTHAPQRGVFLLRRRREAARHSFDGAAGFHETPRDEGQGCRRFSGLVDSLWRGHKKLRLRLGHGRRKSGLQRHGCGRDRGASIMADSLVVRAQAECKWDLVSLGEVMLRLDPGDVRVATTRQFNVWEGGGEYNVARGLRRCFGLKTAIVTALADNPVGRLVEDLMNQGGVDQSHVKWAKYDGVGRTVRNGLNFTERGFGVRAALGCSDRGHTAVSQLKPGDIDWDNIF